MRLPKRIISFCLILIILLITEVPAFSDAEVADKDTVMRFMRDRRFTSSAGTKLPFRIYIPQEYSKEKEYPLVLFFHGAGEVGSDNMKQLLYPYSIYTRLLTPENREKYECIILVPQCAQGSQWVDTPWSKGNYSIDDVPESEFMKAAVELIAWAKKEYKIEDERIYVTGVSMGGFGTWDIISRHPELFAAAIPVCGGGDPSYAEALVDMPIWTFHGSDDSSVPVEGTRKMVEALEAAGSKNIKYTEYENAEHNVWNMAYIEDDLLAWLFGSTKKSIVYDVKVTEGEGGSVTCPATVNYGESLPINVTPASGYEIDKLLVNGEEVILTENSYTISGVYNDIQVEAVFKAAEVIEPVEPDTDTDGNGDIVIYIIAAAAVIIAGVIVAVIFIRRKKSKG